MNIVAVEKKLNELKAKMNELRENLNVSLEDVLDSGKIYYINANDGTDFDWELNDRTCEFMMFYKENEMGIMSVTIRKDGAIKGYYWEDKGNAKGVAVELGQVSPTMARDIKNYLYLTKDRAGKWNDAI